MFSSLFLFLCFFAGENVFAAFETFSLHKNIQLNQQPNIKENITKIKIKKNKYSIRKQNKNLSN